MAITIDDFAKVWASQSPLTPYSFSDAQYKEGWNFVGATPPSRQMWDAFMKNADEKLKYLYNQLALNVPVGCVQAYAGQITPQGWLLCDGSAISRTQYSRLFGVIGTSYGAGDGTDTFNLPNLTDKFIQGNAVVGTEHSAGLPNITGGFLAYSYGGGGGNGAFNSGVDTPNVLKGSVDQDLNWNSYTFDASRSNSIYGNSNTVQPPSVTMRYIIKY